MKQTKNVIIPSFVRIRPAAGRIVTSIRYIYTFCPPPRGLRPRGLRPLDISDIITNINLRVKYTKQPFALDLVDC